jgi:hypothetical protein
MQAPLHRSGLSPTQAEARLRYLDEIQRRTRRAAYSPAYGLLVVGAIALAHGAVITLWAQAGLEWIVWIGALLALRPLIRWLRRRLAQRGLEGQSRVALASATAAVGFTVLAVATGANPLVSALAAASALMAFLASMPVVSLATVAVGLAGDLAIRQGLAAGTSQILVGMALIALGLWSMRTS